MASQKNETPSQFDEMESPNNDLVSKILMFLRA